METVILTLVLLISGIWLVKYMRGIFAPKQKQSEECNPQNGCGSCSGQCEDANV